MYLNRKEHMEVVGMVNEILDELFEGVKDDRQALIDLKHNLGIQDSQIKGWQSGRNTPNTSTLYKLASKAGLRLCVVSKDAK